MYNSDEADRYSFAEYMEYFKVPISYYDFKRFEDCSLNTARSKVNRMLKLGMIKELPSKNGKRKLFLDAGIYLMPGVTNPSLVEGKNSVSGHHEFNFMTNGHEFETVFADLYYNESQENNIIAGWMLWKVFARRIINLKLDAVPPAVERLPNPAVFQDIVEREIYKLENRVSILKRFVQTKQYETGEGRWVNELDWETFRQVVAGFTARLMKDADTEQITTDMMNDLLEQLITYWEDVRDNQYNVLANTWDKPNELRKRGKSEVPLDEENADEEIERLQNELTLDGE